MSEKLYKQTYIHIFSTILLKRINLSIEQKLRLLLKIKIKDEKLQNFASMKDIK